MNPTVVLSTGLCLVVGCVHLCYTKSHNRSIRACRRRQHWSRSWENVCNFAPITLTKLQINLIGIYWLVGPTVLYNVLVEQTTPWFSLDCPEHSLLINTISDKVKSGPLLYSFTQVETNDFRASSWVLPASLYNTAWWWCHCMS